MSTSSAVDAPHYGLPGTARIPENVETVFLTFTSKFRKETSIGSWNICQYYETNFAFGFEGPSLKDDDGIGIVVVLVVKKC